jgi:hypothetical protein
VPKLPPLHIAMSAAARRFPEDNIQVFCSHCNSYVSTKTKYRHLKNFGAGTPQNVNQSTRHTSETRSTTSSDSEMDNEMDPEDNFQDGAQGIDGLEELNDEEMRVPGG